MSVATKNPFAILEAEDASRPASPAPAPKATPPAPSAPSRGSQKRSGPASRGGKYYPRGGPGRSAPRDNNNNANQVTAEEPVSDKQRKFEGGRGRGRGRGAPRGGRRPFDRHSATGKTDSDKKVHQGWGGDEGNTELKQEEAATADAAAEVNPESPSAEPAEGAAAAAAPGEEGAESRPRREREPEEEDTTLTLDQYLAQKKEKEANLPKIEATRRANEGADDDIWKGAVPLTKNEEEQAFYVGKTKSAPKGRSEKKEKIFLEIDGRFDRPERGGRGRGRGGGRGGRGGASRGGRPPRENGNSTPPTVDVDDEAAFPSLS